MAPPFKIGLTMAGAISAGAYTAGVLDFLLQALEEWDRAKRTAGGGVPMHTAEIAVVSGASAGSICAALLAASVGRPHTPMDGANPPPPGQNRLYDTWVRNARIEGLLTTTDLDTAPTLNSALNSDYLTEMARAALDIKPPYARPAYIAEPLEILLTTGNLRGVAYSLPFSGEGADEHDMVLHGDAQHFYMSLSSAANLDEHKVVRLDPSRSDENWAQHLRDAALGSSAFPIGLSARRLSRPAQYYSRRLWPIPRGVAGDPDPKPPSFKYATWYSQDPISPLSPDGKADLPFTYVSVDGGTFNNEPFEMARRILTGDQYRSKRGGSQSDRAVVMVDPFPDPYVATPDYKAELDLKTVIKGLLGAFTQQARFKPEELALAVQPDVFSRFLIAPIRDAGAGETTKGPAMASASLGGFGGFLCEAFRHHDFQLGRRNCQRFLDRHFSLFLNNPLFADANGAPPQDSFNFEGEDPEAPPGQTTFRPIIPLVGSAKPPVPEPELKRMPAKDFDALKQQVAGRTDAIVSKAREIYANSTLMSGASWVLWKWKRGSIIDSLNATIEKGLRDKGLL